MLKLNELYNMDCMEGMAQFPDGYFDLAIVDPPYGINIAARGKVGSGDAKTPSRTFTPSDWDTAPPAPSYFTELMRVSKNQIIWGANHFISRIPFDSSCWLVWDKQNSTTDFADCELAWTSFKSAVRIFRFTWDGFRQGDMKHKETRIHPTQKPVRLYEWVLSKFSKPGYKILDTHTGSASSLIACHRFDLPYIGFEINAEYYTAAKKRIDAETAQLRLF